MQSMDGLSRRPQGPRSRKSLYVGNLNPYVTEAHLQDVFSHLGPVESTKIIRDKASGLSLGYGFVTYSDPNVSEMAIATLNGQILYNQTVKVNWAYPSQQQHEDTSFHYHIFVGDLGRDVDEALLFESFSAAGECTDARIMWNTQTGRSRGYGFVSFRTQQDAENAIKTMHGKLLGSRHIRCGWAQHKQDNLEPLEQSQVDREDPTNTNVHVSNLAPEVMEDDLREVFQEHGEIRELKIIRKGGYGFVTFQRHEDAVVAICSRHGSSLAGKVIKCSWGRNPNRPEKRVPGTLPFIAGQGRLGGTAAAAAAAAAAVNGQGGVMLPGLAVMNAGLQVQGANRTSGINHPAAAAMLGASSAGKGSASGSFPNTFAASASHHLGPSLMPGPPIGAVGVTGLMPTNLGTLSSRPQDNAGLSLGGINLMGTGGQMGAQTGMGRVPAGMAGMHLNSGMAGGLTGAPLNSASGQIVNQAPIAGVTANPADGKTSLNFGAPYGGFGLYY